MATHGAIELQRVTKYFGERAVLRGLSLRVDLGQTFGLFGVSGSGKTTLLRTLVGLPPNAGRARVLGQSCVDERVKLRRRIGFAPEAPFFFDYLKGWEVLHFAGEMFGLAGLRLNDTVATLFDWLCMREAADEYVKCYTPGMRKKLALAAALVHEPEVLLLDEPTAGVDDASTEELVSLIGACRSAGTTILLTTQSLSVAERLCDTVGVLRDGALEVLGSPSSVTYRGGVRVAMGGPWRRVCSAG